MRRNQRVRSRTRGKAVPDLHVLTMKSASQTIRIDTNDMIHITWKHATIRLNVTGLIYLVDFVNGERAHTVGFDITGTMDDGYQLWIEDIGLRLTPAEFEIFTQLLEDGLQTLRALGKTNNTQWLPACLRMTTVSAMGASYSQN